MAPPSPSYSDDLIRSVLSRVKSIAVVGASANTVRPSYFVAKYLKDKGYQVFPVNPGLAGQTIAGMEVFGSLSDIPTPVDMVEIFRNSEAAGPITDEAIAIGAKVVWMQLGVINQEAADRAEAAGLTVIMDRCPKMEFGRMNGEMGWVGANSQVIDNRRKPLGDPRANLSRVAIGQGKGGL